MAIETAKNKMYSGDLYCDTLGTDGLPTGSFLLGNFDLTIKKSSDKKELIGKQNANFGAAVETVYIAKPDECELKGNGVTSALWALFLGGDYTSAVVTSGATVEAEAHTIVTLNKAIKLTNREPTVIAIAKSTDTAVAATTQDTGDTVTKTSHGLLDGDVVFFTILATTTGVAIHIPYYVVNKTANTFQLSLTSGGAVLPLTTDGTASYRKAVTPASYSVENARLGLINILSGGSVAVADVLHVYYTFATNTHNLITAGTKASNPVRLYGDLEDRVSPGSFTEFNAPKVVLTSTGDITLIGEEFVEVGLSGTFISVNTAPAFSFKDFA